MKKLFLVFAVAAFFVACDNSATEVTTPAADSIAPVEVAPATPDTTMAPADSTAKMPASTDSAAK